MFYLAQVEPELVQPDQDQVVAGAKSQDFEPVVMLGLRIIRWSRMLA